MPCQIGLTPTTLHRWVGEALRTSLDSVRFYLQSEGQGVARVKHIEFDPIEEARRQWVGHGWADAAQGMAVVTSVFRAQRIYMARIDTVLRPFELTFARFELLTLLYFTRTGSLPMNKLGVRLQVHPTSVTSCVDRLEGTDLVRRVAHDTDRRTTLVEILPAGRKVLYRAMAALNEEVFANPGFSEEDCVTLFGLLHQLRADEGDFGN